MLTFIEKLILVLISTEDELRMLAKIAKIRREMTVSKELPLGDTITEQSKNTVPENIKERFSRQAQELSRIMDDIHTTALANKAVIKTDSAAANTLNEALQTISEVATTAEQLAKEINIEDQFRGFRWLLLASSIDEFNDTVNSITALSKIDDYLRGLREFLSEVKQGNIQEDILDKMNEYITKSTRFILNFSGHNVRRDSVNELRDIHTSVLGIRDLIRKCNEKGKKKAKDQENIDQHLTALLHGLTG